MGLAEIFANAFGSDRRLHGVQVTYVRDGSEISVKATVGRTGRQVEDADGFPLRVRFRDYLIAVEDLAIDDEPFQPQEDDIIREVIDGKTFAFEVTSEGAEACWRYSDSAQRDYRIHTQAVTEES